MKTLEFGICYLEFVIFTTFVETKQPYIELSLESCNLLFN